MKFMKSMKGLKARPLEIFLVTVQRIGLFQIASRVIKPVDNPLDENLHELHVLHGENPSAGPLWTIPEKILRVLHFLHGRKIRQPVIQGEPSITGR